MRLDPRILANARRPRGSKPVSWALRPTFTANKFIWNGAKFASPFWYSESAVRDYFGSGFDSVGSPDVESGVLKLAEGDALRTTETYGNVTELFIACRFLVPVGSSNTLFDRIFEMGGFVSSGSSEAGIGLEQGTNSNELEVVIWGTDVRQETQTFNYSEGEWIDLVVYAPTTQNAKFWVNGRNEQTVARTRDAEAVNLALGARQRFITQNQSNVWFDYFFIVEGRSTSQQEAAALHADPYAPFRPSYQLPALFGQPAAGGTALPVIARNHYRQMGFM